MKKFTVTWDEIHVIRYQTNVRAIGGKMAERIVKTNFKTIRSMNGRNTLQKTIHVKNLRINEDSGS